MNPNIRLSKAWSSGPKDLKRHEIDDMIRSLPPLSYDNHKLILRETSQLQNEFIHKMHCPYIHNDLFQLSRLSHVQSGHIYELKIEMMRNAIYEISQIWIENILSKIQKKIQKDFARHLVDYIRFHCLFKHSNGPWRRWRMLKTMMTAGLDMIEGLLTRHFDNVQE